MIISKALALLAVAILAGCYLDGSLVLVPAQRRLSGPAYAEVEQANTALGTIRYRLLLGLALLGQIMLLAVDHRPASPLFLLTLASGAVLIGTTVFITVLRVVPINRTVHTWRAVRPPADWAAVRDHWHRLHHRRTALVVLALVVQTAAVFAH